MTVSGLSTPIFVNTIDIVFGVWFITLGAKMKQSFLVLGFVQDWPANGTS